MCLLPNISYSGSITTVQLTVPWIFQCRDFSSLICPSGSYQPSTHAWRWAWTQMDCKPKQGAAEQFQGLEEGQQLSGQQKQAADTQQKAGSAKLDSFAMCPIQKDRLLISGEVLQSWQEGLPKGGQSHFKCKLLIFAWRQPEQRNLLNRDFRFWSNSCLNKIRSGIKQRNWTCNIKPQIYPNSNLIIKVALITSLVCK